jgi:uncharacterized RDD family membrane protein YckC
MRSAQHRAVPPSPPVRPAPLARRVAAALIDWWVLFFLALLWVFLGLPRFDLLWYPLFALYAGLAWTLGGASIGKWLLGLALVGPDGRRPEAGRVLARLAVLLVGSPLGITWWPLLLRADRRALHDLLTGTQVVLARPQGLAWHLATALAERRWLVATLLALGTVLAIRLADDLLGGR